MIDHWYRAGRKPDKQPGEEGYCHDADDPDCVFLDTHNTLSPTGKKLQRFFVYNSRAIYTTVASILSIPKDVYNWVTKPAPPKKPLTEEEMWEEQLKELEAMTQYNEE